MQATRIYALHPALRLPTDVFAGGRVNKLPWASAQAQPGQALLEAAHTAHNALCVTLSPAIASAELARRLGFAALRGVDVSVLVPHAHALSMLWYARVDEWLLNGVKVFQNEQPQVSAAVCVVDGHWTSVFFTSGFDPSGQVVDASTELLIQDAGVARALTDFFHAQCQEARALQPSVMPGPLGWLRSAHHKAERR